MRKRTFLLILLVGAALRIYLVGTAAGVNNDAFKYARIARAMVDRGVVAGIDGDYFWPYFPVNRQLVAYSLAGSIVNCFIGDIILSLRIVSMVCGIGLIWAVYALCRELVTEEEVALLGAALVAFHPEFARASAAVYREVPMAFLLSLGVLFFLWSIHRHGGVWIRWALWAGLVLFIAFMTRPDGAAAAAAVGALCLVGARNVPLKRRVTICLLMGGIFLAFQIPYALHVHQKSGRWLVNQWQIQNRLTPCQSARQHLLGPASKGVEDSQ
jgi:4-amino-4-deoxy-L-arabinose transferase-like glycosyltransferase